MRAGERQRWCGPDERRQESAAGEFPTQPGGHSAQLFAPARRAHTGRLCALSVPKDARSLRDDGLQRGPQQSGGKQSNAKRDAQPTDGQPATATRSPVWAPPSSARDNLLLALVGIGLPMAGQFGGAAQKGAPKVAVCRRPPQRAIIESGRKLAPLSLSLSLSLSLPTRPLPLPICLFPHPFAPPPLLRLPQVSPKSPSKRPHPFCFLKNSITKQADDCCWPVRLLARPPKQKQKQK